MAPKYIRTEENLEDITVSRYFILKSQATFQNFKKIIKAAKNDLEALNFWAEGTMSNENYYRDLELST